MDRVWKRFVATCNLGLMGYLTLDLSGSSFNNCTLNFRESMNHANLESECNFCCFSCLLILDDLFLGVTLFPFFFLFVIRSGLSRTGISGRAILLAREHLIWNAELRIFEKMKFLVDVFWIFNGEKLLIERTTQNLLGNEKPFARYILSS